MSVSISGYSLVSKLGEGGMGTVFKAVHELTGREVAIKVLPPHLSADEEYRRRFLREARAAAALNHKNITKVNDAGEQNGLYYIVMEYVDGENLTNIVSASGPLETEYALSVAREVALGLAHAHANGIVHRDIKPDNIMLNLKREAKITDMGLAKKLKLAEEGPDITQDGMILGTPKYMSPEQILRPESVDFRTDIYSLGATLYSMLTGSAPFDSEISTEVIASLIGEPPRYPRSMPRPVVRLLKALMAKKPDRRPSSAQDVVAMIDRTVEELRRAPAERHIDAPRHTREHPTPRKSAAGTVLALVAVGVIIVIVLAAMSGTEELPETSTDNGSSDTEHDKPLLEPPVRSGVDTTASRKKFEEVLEYAKENPDKHKTVVNMLQHILQQETVDAALSARIQGAIAEWTGKWETEAKNKWEKVAAEARKLADDGDFAGAIKVLEAFPQEYRESGTCGKEYDAEIARVRGMSSAASALKEIETDASDADREFTIDEIERARTLLVRLVELNEKHKDVEAVAEKLVPAIAKLKVNIEKLQRELDSREFYKTTAPFVRAYDFEAALKACADALKDAPGNSARKNIEREKRDIESLRSLCELFREKMRQATAQKKKLRLSFLDGTNVRGAITDEDGTLLVEAKEKYIIDLRTLHPDSVLTHSGLDDKSPQNRLTIAMFYAHASFHEKAAQYFEKSKESLSPEDAKFYDVKFAYLKEKYPVPEKLKAAVTAEPTEYEAHLWGEIGRELQDAYRAKDAAQAMLRALKISPADKDTASDAARLLIQLHDYREAAAVARRALSRHKDNARLLLQEALALHYMRKHKEALKRIDKAIAAGQDNSTSHMIRAGVLNMLRKPKEAREAAAEAIRKNRPGYTPTPMTDTEFENKLQEAIRLTEEGKFAESGAIASKILASRPENAVAYNVLGGSVAYRHRYRESLQIFTAASILDPKLNLAYLNIGYAYTLLGEPDLALAALEVARGLKLISKQKHALEIRLNEAKKALEKLEASWKENYDRGKQLCRQRMYNEAIKSLLLAVKLKNPSSYFWMGHCRIGLGQPSKALREFDKGILIQPDTHDNYYGRGLALKALRRYEEAVKSFKKCSQLHTKKFNKDHYESWIAMADCYRHLGKTEEAAEAQRKAQGLRSGK